MTQPDRRPAEDPSASDPYDVAIVGMSMRLPGAQTPQAYWQMLRSGREVIQHFTDDELLARGVPERLLQHPDYVKSGRVLTGVDLFDAEFFGFSPKDAAILDPQHRHFLECAWEALEDAGHPPAGFPGSIGVFGGCGMGSYFTFNLLSNPELVENVGLFLLRHTGNDKDFLPTRVSYCLDLKGPSISIQTACSTSLVAVHVAAQSLIAGECDMALAGGVTIDLPHGVGYLYRQGEILSPDGHCRALDHRPMGTVFGSGAGIVALRRLEDAVRDGDRIYAVLKGSAVNNDGAGKVGYMAPSVDGLASVIAEALATAGVDPDTIGFVEAHGSGTAMGVPIEIAAMRQVFGRSSSRTAPCGLGAVKANIGHLDTAAGVAGLIKTALALHHGELPPTPNVEAPNAAVPQGDTVFSVIDRLQPWPRLEAPRRAGVSALGVGGTNAHVVLEEAPEPAPSSAPGRTGQLLCLSARSKGALDKASSRLAKDLRAHPHRSLADVAYTLAAGRHAFGHRRVLACHDAEEAADLLDTADPQRIATHAAGTSPASVAFLLPGGGAQHARMGLDLYEGEPVFREHVDRGIDAFLRRKGRDLRPIWISPTNAARAGLELEQPALQLPAIFILEHALAQLWSSLGVRPDALIGHSLGENTAACLAGVLSFEDALGLVALRGELFETLPSGGMLSVPLSVDELRPYLGPDLDVAAVNAPAASVASGPSEALDFLAQRLMESGVDARRIPISTAAHSRMVDPLLQPFVEYLRSIRLHPPRIPFLSNLTGTWITDEQATDPGYWADHLRGTVRFSDGIRTLLTDPDRVLLEVGPGRALSSLARQQAGPTGRGVLASMRHEDEKVADTIQCLTTFGRLWACGVPLDLGVLWQGERRRRVSLPTYPFQRQRYWIDPGRPAEVVDETPAPSSHVDLLEDGLYRPVWKPVPAATAADTGRRHTWLLFLDAAGVGERLAKRLRKRGDTVLCVHESDDNRRLDEDEYALAPERGREGYDDLVRDLVARGRSPDRIVHLWMLTPDESFRPGSNFFHRNQERGFYSLFFLAQALGEEGTTGPLHVTVCSNGMQALDGEPLLHPSKATVLGPCKVIPRELPGLTCSTLDLPLPVSRTKGRPHALRQDRLDALVDSVMTEVLSEPRCAIVATRDGVRHEQAFEHVVLGSAEPLPLREEGVYLLTGGLGGLGLVVASDLARRVHARLTLVGRTPLPDPREWDEWLRLHAHDDTTSRKIRAVREMEAAGAEVYVACADVTDVEAMRRVIDETRRRFGALHGVVHAAGLVRDAPLLSKTQADVEQVFAPKLHGALVLDLLLRDIDLDVLVLFSSASTVVAPPGQVDYVAANAFLDAYAQAASTTARGRRRRRRTVAVNWGIWGEVGMAADALRAAEVSAPRTATGRVPEHPLFDSREGNPDSPLVLRARYAARTHWILDEHRTLERSAVLPGTAYFELARAALLEAHEDPAFELRDLLLLRPLHVPDGESRDVEIELVPSEEGYAFLVRSRAAAGGSAEITDQGEAWEVHAQARLVMEAPPEPARVPLAEIEARTTLHRSAGDGEALPPGQADRVHFGPRWQALREVRLGTGEALAALSLGKHAAGDLATLGLHPALLDVALTIGLELPELASRPATDAATWVPLTVGRVRVHAPLTANIRSWVRSHATNRADSDILLFDAVVVTDDGRVCLEVEEFGMRRWKGEPGTTTPTRTADAPERPRPMPSPSRSALQRHFELGIVPEDGMSALLRILGHPDLPQVVASSLDLDGLRREVEALGATNEPEPDGGAPPAVDVAFEGSPDGIERTLAGFWQELLGVRSVGLRDSFFDLGGHSLIAVRLFARIKKAYKVEFPISLLFEAPTIERCAAAIRRAVEARGEAPVKPAAAQAPRYTHLVPMHPGQGGDRTPFFLVAGMFGNVLNLRHLAHLLGSARRFYGIQALGLYGAHRLHESFEEMAADYLAEVRRVQPSGPYLLGGFSGGGITAYEMAQQLLAAGEEVHLLAMLDTRLPTAPTLRANERLRIHWQRLCRDGPPYLARWVRNRLRWETARLIERWRDDPDAPMPSEFRSEEIGAAFRRALPRYELQPYPGTITLFRPRLDEAHVLGPGRVTNTHRDFVFHDNGWGAWARNVDVHEVPGDHDSMVLEPNVRVLAARLRECLREVESGKRIIVPAAASHVPGR
ncbi:MAG: type I polyketide synthase [Planctomycetota bacterium]